jgi:hypothetical protein
MRCPTRPPSAALRAYFAPGNVKERNVRNSKKKKHAPAKRQPIQRPSKRQIKRHCKVSPSRQEELHRLAMLIIKHQIELPRDLNNDELAVVVDIVCENRRRSLIQHCFAAMLPEVVQNLQRTFCGLDFSTREEAMGEAIMHSLLAYIRLHDQGREAVASPSSLAFYSARQVKSGRPAAGRMNGKEPLSRYAQLRNRIRVERPEWIELLVADKRASVPEQVALKLDMNEWFSGLSQRMKQIANDLAFGFSTSEVAQRQGVTAGRISQLRRTLEKSWNAFQQGTAQAPSC